MCKRAVKLLQGIFSSDDTNQKEDNCDNKEDMNKSSKNIKPKEAKRPKD